MSQIETGHRGDGDRLRKVDQRSSRSSSRYIAAHLNPQAEAQLCKRRAGQYRARADELTHEAVGLLQLSTQMMHKAAAFRDPTAHPDAEPTARADDEKDAQHHAQLEDETSLSTADKLTRAAQGRLRDAGYAFDQAGSFNRAASALERASKILVKIPRPREGRYVRIQGSRHWRWFRSDEDLKDNVARSRCGVLDRLAQGVAA